MQYQFRKSVKDAQKAAMGKMYNLAKINANAGEHIINFASGHPDSNVFRNDLMKKFLLETVNENKNDFYQYGSHIGFAPLRNSLVNFENGHGKRVKKNDNIIITYGATEGISLMAMAMINPGDRVLVECPTYVNAIKTFKLYGANIIGIPLYNDGVDLDVLESEMKKGAKFFYTIPNFNNPTGITTSLEKRKKIYELAVKNNVLILEDNSYGELRYKEERIESIKDLDDCGMVIYISTLSKYVAPAVRIGYMVANEKFIDRCVSIKAVTTNGVTNILQYVMWKMFQEINMDEAILKTCKVYAKKLNVMEKCMDDLLPKEIIRTSPNGGMYIWVTLPNYIDVNVFCERSARELHIPITPGTEFCINNPDKCTSMRFNFVKESENDIIKGIEKVAILMNEVI